MHLILMFLMQVPPQIEDPKGTVDARDITIPIPPGLWRKGVECGKAKCILLRFSTRNDRKPPQAEKLSEYYRIHGNPNYGGTLVIFCDYC